MVGVFTVFSVAAPRQLLLLQAQAANKQAPQQELARDYPPVWSKLQKLTGADTPSRHHR